MTFNPIIPLATQSPGLFPSQCNTNFTRLKTLINADHVFNDTAPGAPPNNDGAHRQCTMVARLTPTAPLAAGTNGIFYCFLDPNSRPQLAWYNGTTNVQITPGVVAAVNFDGTGAISANQTIRSQLNVATVFKNSTGVYTITFANNLPDNNYIVQLTGMSDINGNVASCTVLRNGAYGNTVKIDSVQIQTNSHTSSVHDVLMGNVTILRYTNI